MVTDSLHLLTLVFWVLIICGDEFPHRTVFYCLFSNFPLMSLRHRYCEFSWRRKSDLLTAPGFKMWPLRLRLHTDTTQPHFTHQEVAAHCLATKGNRGNPEKFLQRALIITLSKRGDGLCALTLMTSVGTFTVNVRGLNRSKWICLRRDTLMLVREGPSRGVLL